MKLYTSYYGNIKNIPNEIVIIGISAYTPEKIDILRYNKLQPPKKLLSKYKNCHFTERQYTEEYNQCILENLNVQEVYDDLLQLSKGKDACLICYEKPPKFCHRMLVANWFRLYGISCEEYPYKQ